MSEFPPFRLDTVNQCLWRTGDRDVEAQVPLTPKAFAMLHYLVEHPGRLVTHDELLDAIWAGIHVQQEVLKSHISELRAALGDRPKKPLFIETVQRRGYRFIAPLSQSGLANPTAAAGAPPRRLVGREHSLGQLANSFRNMLTGTRHIVFVTGEAGIGKTALVDAFARQAAAEAPNVRIALGQCVEGYGSKEAYYPMLEAIAGLCRGNDGGSVIQILATEAPTWLLQFPALLTPDRGAILKREVLGATRERMLREIGDALEAIAARRPLVIVFEDLQWVDYATVDLISVVARRRGPATLMLVATYRDDEVALMDHPVRALKRDLRSRQLCDEIALEPLTESHVAEYLSSNSIARLPKGFAELVHRHSEGNPLFMVATLNHLVGRGLLARDARGWHLTTPLNEIDLVVPDGLRELIEAQIERLSLEERRVLEVACLTQHRSFSVIARAAAAMDAAPDRFEEVCEKLSRRTGILRSASLEELPDGTVSPFYEFTHALYREVLYDRIAPIRKAQLHRQAAEWAEARFGQRMAEAAPFLAYHFEHGADWTRAVKYLRIAADTAGRRYAPREARAHLEHALELCPRLTEAERATHEPAILEQLAAMYVVSFDTRAIDTYETLAAKAAAYGLVDLEVKALIDMTYPLSWIDGERALGIVDRALRLGAQQHDSLRRARTRASCLVRRVWTGGWNARDAAECREAIAEIGRDGDRLLIAAHLIDFNFIRWGSSEYRAAYRDVVDSLRVLVDGEADNPYLNFAHWLSEFTLPWSLLFLGEWGEALRTLAAEIALAEKNGDRYRAQTLQLYRAWVHLHAQDFAAVQQICDAVRPSLDEAARRPWRRFSLALAGTAAAASGQYDAAWEHLSTARREMDRRPVINDWYCRMMLEEGLTELWLAKSDLGQARPESERFLELTLATAERTWQAIAWETGARVAIAEGDLQRAHDWIDHAVSTLQGVEIPLAAWRVHRSAVKLYARAGDQAAAEHYRTLSRTTILTLADSLADEAALRHTFLSAPSVRDIIASERQPPRPRRRTT